MPSAVPVYGALLPSVASPCVTIAELSPDPELEPLSLAPPVLPPDLLRVKRLNILDRRPPITVPFLDLLSLSASSLATSVPVSYTHLRAHET